jgi:hypothetical protein
MLVLPTVAASQRNARWLPQAAAEMLLPVLLSNSCLHAYCYNRVLGCTLCSTQCPSCCRCLHCC